MRKTLVHEGEYLEVELRCGGCGLAWREIYERGQLVKSIDMTPEPKEPRAAIEEVTTCPYCGEHCGPKSGVQYDMETSFSRIRQYAHPICHTGARLGFPDGIPPMPYGPDAFKTGLKIRKRSVPRGLKQKTPAKKSSLYVVHYDVKKHGWVVKGIPGKGPHVFESEHYAKQYCISKTGIVPAVEKKHLGEHQQLPRNSVWTGAPWDHSFKDAH